MDKTLMWFQNRKNIINIYNFQFHLHLLMQTGERKRLRYRRVYKIFSNENLHEP